MEGPDFSARMGGLYCDKCKKDCPCGCEKDKVVEKIKNPDKFKIV